jgi:hypothetical protein
MSHYSKESTHSLHGDLYVCFHTTVDIYFHSRLSVCEKEPTQVSVHKGRPVIDHNDKCTDLNSLHYSSDEPIPHTCAHHKMI